MIILYFEHTEYWNTGLSNVLKVLLWKYNKLMSNRCYVVPLLLLLLYTLWSAVEVKVSRKSFELFIFFLFFDRLITGKRFLRSGKQNLISALFSVMTLPFLCAYLSICVSCTYICHCGCCLHDCSRAFASLNVKIGQLIRVFFKIKTSYKHSCISNLDWIRTYTE